jgi:Skp family chaperone for outer membrane proteins
MKTKLLTLMLFIVTSASVSAQSATDKWPAIKDLHTVVSETFHPAEEGNLAPIKARSQELFDKASALLKSDIPAEYRTNAILNSAEKLQLKARALHKLVVAKASDGEIMNALTEVHNYFHEIVGLCTDKK